MEVSEILEGSEKIIPKIRRLDQSVVNRIAAGEVVQRPVSAVKELVENSLDAGSTSISVVVKDGGMKLIQVTDNGHGIRFDDLPILCERHTTSKLSTYEDLQTVKSMGFRGEALASMTYVGHVTVTTITEGRLHGYRVSYRDGVMEHDPKPCAAVKGTQITVENLFYNMLARKKSLQNSNDDYTKIVDLISRFAIHNIHVSFSCRKHGANRADVHTIAACTKFDSIRSVFGVSVSHDILEITASDDNPDRSVFKLNGFVSNANYIAKKTTMVLFINDRLVECTALKRAIEVVYSATLPKASKPFIYMTIQLPHEHVDVNIHPTKREVSFLNQENIISTIQNAVETKLMNSNSILSKEIAVNSQSSGQKTPKVPVNKMVRTDSKDPAGRLHSYWQDKHASQDDKRSELSCVRVAVRQRRNPKKSADLTSLHELLNEIDQNTHSSLLDIVKNCTYVGMADDIFALIQHDTRLYLVNVVNVSEELMYQQVLRRFAHFNAIQLSDPAPIHELIMMALSEENAECEDVESEDFNKIAEMNTELLKQKAELLQEYFGIDIDQKGFLLKLPVILDQYTPNMDRVPEFMLTLGNDVEWDDEKKCFQTISAAIGNFYAMQPPILPNPSGDGAQFYKNTEAPDNRQNKDTDANMIDDISEKNGTTDQKMVSEAETEWAQREWTIQHVLIPSMRLFFKPPIFMAGNGTFVQVASLEKLYKIFERC
ncbi:hypothetical protein ZOSMA_83G00490 [Zostera marina]|uniref:DNA mismatch repair protein S5 domain-containing protein n=1 Tax=Zostera marina TaxID=29655 RepID=A0A0K9NNN2_ZOSMR|nr:hypothetical protein ZOSMA_83G00490 [Zostera marina]